MKKRLLLLVGCLSVAVHAQMGLPASGTQTVFRVTAPVVPAATQTVLSVEQPPFPTARTTAPSPVAPRPMLSLAEAFSNLTETASPSVVQPPTIPNVPVASSVVPPPQPTLQMTPPELSAPAVQRTFPLAQAVSNLTPNIVPVAGTQPAIPVVPSVAAPTLPTVRTTPPEVSVPTVQPAFTLSQTVSNLTQNALPSVTQPATPSIAQPMPPAAWGSAPVTQAGSVLNQAVSVLTQRVSAVSQTALSLTQQTFPAVQTDVSLIPTSSVPNIPSISQPVLPSVQVQEMNSGATTFHISNAGIRPPSPQFRQVEIPYYGVDESNVAELPVGLRFYESRHIDGNGLESTWTNGVFSYEDSGRYTQRLSIVAVGQMIVTNTIAEQIRIPVVSTNISQVGNATFVSEKTIFLSQGIWVGDTLKYPTTSTAENNKIVVSSLNGRTVKLARKEDIILELAQPSSRVQGGIHLSNPTSGNAVSALDALPRATATVPRMDLPEQPVFDAPRMVPSLPSVSGNDTNTLSLVEAQARGLDIRLREVTVIKWVLTTNNYNNLPRRTPVPHKMWVLGSEPVAERFELF